MSKFTWTNSELHLKETSEEYGVHFAGNRIVVRVSISSHICYRILGEGFERSPRLSNSFKCKYEDHGWRCGPGGFIFTSVECVMSFNIHVECGMVLLMILTRILSCDMLWFDLPYSILLWLCYNWYQITKWADKEEGMDQVFRWGGERIVIRHQLTQ